MDFFQCLPGSGGDDGHQRRQNATQEDRGLGPKAVQVRCTKSLVGSNMLGCTFVSGQVVFIFYLYICRKNMYIGFLTFFEVLKITKEIVCLGGYVRSVPTTSWTQSIDPNPKSFAPRFTLKHHDVSEHFWTHLLPIKLGLGLPKNRLTSPMTEAR